MPGLTLGPARISWPGVRGVESFAYTCSHGASPGTAVLVTLPRSNAEPSPAAFGDLVWGDGRRTVRLRDCKLDGLAPRVDSSGYSWMLTIFDRRWRWRTPDANFGRISGSYNERDAQKKLVPETIRSPEELAKLCLKAMGETRYEIALPKGLTRADGAKYADKLKAGENFPETFTNPAVIWNCTPPHEALSQLCDLFGCRLIYQPISNKVIIAPLGVGPGLPGYPASSLGVSLDLPEKPKLVGVEGTSTLFQWRFALEAVGKEWNGTYLPINDLSYAPEGAGDAGQKQTVKYNWAGEPDLPDGVVVTLSLNLFRSYAAAVTKSFQSDAAGSVLDNLVAVAGLINADADASSMLVASVENDPDSGNPSVLKLEGRREGEMWGSAVVATDAGAIAFDLIQFVMPREPGSIGGWEDCPPETMASVKTTKRLLREQAQELARDSVFKCYRIRLVNVETGTGPFQSPGYTKPIVRRRQIVLTPYLNDLVKPEPRRPGGVLRERARPGPVEEGSPNPLFRDGVIPPYYNGYATAQQARVYGAVSTSIGRVLWDDDDGDGNSDPETEVTIPFTVVEGEQMIQFAAPVYARAKLAKGYDRQRVPRLTLECAVVVKDADTNMPAVAEFTRDLGGAGGEEWQPRDDIQVTYTARYGKGNKLGPVERDWDDAKKRAEHYLDAMARKHELDGADERTFIGIYPIDPNGLIQQVTWSIGGGGFTTRASANSEHSRGVSPYPERRRVENLPPNGFAAAANLLERFQIETGKKIPNPLDVARRIRRGLI